MSRNCPALILFDFFLSKDKYLVEKNSLIAKLNFNFNFNLIESWDGFILNSSTPPNHLPTQTPTHPWKSSEHFYLTALPQTLTTSRPQPQPNLNPNLN